MAKLARPCHKRQISVICIIGTKPDYADWGGDKNFTGGNSYYSQSPYSTNAAITDSATTMKMGYKTILRARLLTKSTFQVDLK